MDIHLVRLRVVPIPHLFRSRPRRPQLADRSTVVVEHDPSEPLHDYHSGHGGHEEHPTSTGISNAKLGMWVFLASDCLLFGALISTYLLVRRETGNGPGPEEIFDIGFTSVSSFVLLMSSLTIVLAINALGRGEVQRSRVWIASTAMLGSVFIAGQVYEFTSLCVRALVTPPASSHLVSTRSPGFTVST